MSKRPGTVDYSKWDNFEDSSDDSSEEEEKESTTMTTTRKRNSDHSNRRIVSPRRTISTDNNNTRHQPSSSSNIIPLPSLAALQRAWNTDLSTITRPCSNCFRPDAAYRCSRCQLVRYCNVTCQSAYHPIHRLECIDAGLHRKFWGMLDGGSKKSGEEGEGVKDDFIVLRARRSSKRRESIHDKHY